MNAQNCLPNVSPLTAMLESYLRAGFALVPITQGKGPTTSGWNRRENCVTRIDQLNPFVGYGLAHAYSMPVTCALDIDSWAEAIDELRVAGIDLMALVQAPDSVMIDSGNPGHAKLLFTLPFGLTPPSKKISRNGKVVFELRCASNNGTTMQDLLPSAAIHPTTHQNYKWAGNGHFSKIPVIPQELFDLWQSLLTVPDAAAPETKGTEVIDWPEIESALAAIDPDCSRDEWITVGMALQYAGTQSGELERGHNQWGTWSAKGKKYRGEREIAQQWHSFKAGRSNARKLGSLFKLAWDKGWVRPPPDVSTLFSDTGAYIERPETSPQHPLARFVDCAGPVMPPRWVIPGFIAHGVVVISGSPGVGKTTAMLPLAMTAAGLHGDDALMPREWRHVVYISEDVEQAKRILAGIAGHGILNIAEEAVRERIHIVEAVRLAPSYVATVGKTYREELTRMVAGVAVLPLVVIDTKSAVLALESENDNSEASAMMAALKQGFDGLPVWLIGHLAKQNLGRSDVLNLSSRGAGAIEGDANQTMFLVREGDNRFLVLGKTRFEPQWPELAITSHTATITAKDEFGKLEAVTLRWGIARPGQRSRKEAAEQAAALAREQEEATLRQEVLKAVGSAWQAGDPLNRTGLRGKIPRKAEVVGNAVDNLLAERWLHEVEVPANERTGPSRSRFLVGFTPEEHEVIVRCGELPEYKLVIPPTWKKSMTATIPAPPVPNPPVP